MRKPSNLLNPDNRDHLFVYFSWFLLVVSMIGWPLTALTVFKNEPPGILGLSWAAIIIGALQNLMTARVKRDQ